MEGYHSTVDVLIGALRRCGRESYLHAVVYFGEHGRSRHGLAEDIGRAVAKQMEAYHDEQLTGIQLVYATKFINLIEGSEATIMTHLQDIANMARDPQSGVGPKVRIFLERCHLKRRMFNKFETLMGAPPSAAGRFSSNPRIPDLARHYKNFFDKYFKVVDYVRKNPEASTSLDNTKSKAAMMLPEPELIDFMLREQDLLSVEKVVEGRKCPPFFEIYDDVIWPVPRTNMPYSPFSADPRVALDEKSTMAQVPMTALSATTRFKASAAARSEPQ